MPAKTALIFNFANTPNFLDPRIQFQRNTIATYVNSVGNIAYAPVNAPRWTFDPVTGECLGIIIESLRINSALYSEDLTNAAWTKTNCSVTTNSSVAPDGATTADTITVSTTNGQVSQNITITAANSIIFSVFAKQTVSGFLRLRITDGTNPVTAWFNLATQLVGTNTSGASTCVFAGTQIETYQNGWTRCALAVNTSTATAFTVSMAPTSGDGVDPAAANTVLVWGAQAEAMPATQLGVGTYIPTTSSTATRNADNYYIPISTANDKWFNVSEGSIYIEFQNKAFSNATSIVWGGIGETFSNTIYLGKQTSSLVGTFINSAVAVVALQTFSPTLDQRAKMIAAWGDTSVVITVDGATPTVSSTNTPAPASTIRMAVGAAPWSASAVNTTAFGNIRNFTYYPQKLSLAEMSEITTP